MTAVSALAAALQSLPGDCRFEQRSARRLSCDGGWGLLTGSPTQQASLARPIQAWSGRRRPDLWERSCW